ncbi:MAG TPA: hypothetical protein ENH99_01985 [Candidatus Pacearchaeota archaeon]|nr:hypothetical protein [Candidatus Pacearchaeota archaeon]
MLRDTLMKYRGPLLVAGIGALGIGGSFTNLAQNLGHSPPPIIEEMNQIREEVSDINAYLDSHPKPGSETYLNAQTTRDSLEGKRDRLENTVEGVNAISERKRLQETKNNSLVLYIVSAIPLMIGFSWGFMKKNNMNFRP